MSKKNLTTRIIAGKYKGKTLDLPPLDTTRSSKAILKESFFNVIQYDIIDSIFVEAFGGSGSIGLEALSRGAFHTYFCEIDRRSYKVLQSNCDIVSPSDCTTLMGDSFEIIPTLVNKLPTDQHTNRPTVIYIDPPFDFRDGMEDIYDDTYKMVESFENENIFMIVFEHKSELILPEIIGTYKQYKTKKFGNSSLSYYERS